MCPTLCESLRSALHIPEVVIVVVIAVIVVVVVVVVDAGDVFDPTHNNMHRLNQLESLLP